MERKYTIKEAIEIMKEVINKDLKFSNKEEMINFLKEKGYEIKKTESRFIEVQFSNRNNVLLEDGDGNGLIGAWRDEEFLNNFECFTDRNIWHFVISGEANKFEFLYKGEWLICDNSMPILFLKKESKARRDEIKKTERFLKVKFSNRNNVFLEDKDGEPLVETYIKEKDLNDFEWIEEKNVGQFWIRGYNNKFEFLYNDEWLECNEDRKSVV